MFAIRIEEFGEPELLVSREVPEPSPGPNEVMIEVHAAGVNFPDLLVVAGTYQTLAPLPFTPGKEGAGIVASVGKAVTAFRPGDRVCFETEAGGFAQFVCVRSEHCFPVPDTISFDVAAVVGLAYQTAYFSLAEDGQVKPGDWVLVLGASGGVGTAAVQLAKAMGAKVIAAVSTPSKAGFVDSLGADATVDVSTPDLNESLRRQVRAIRGGGGVDVVIDPVGGRFFDAALRTLAPGGRLVVIGFASGSIGTVGSNYLLLKYISVVGSNWGFYREGDFDRIAKVQAEIFRLIESGAIKSPVTRLLPMQSVPHALRMVKELASPGKSSSPPLSTIDKGSGPFEPPCRLGYGSA